MAEYVFKEISEPREVVTKMALDGEIVLSSPLGIAILKEKIEATINEVNEATKQMRLSANSDQDLPENTEYMTLRTRIQYELPRQLDDLKILAAKTRIFSENVPGKISFGVPFKARVVYSDNEFVLLGPIEASKKNALDNVTVISYLAPMGSSLWGKDSTNGIEYTFSTPGGEARCIIKN
jgi:transcription elongation GreA/GreB family factor